KGFMGTSSIVYVSIPDTTSTCANLGLPPLPSPWQYRCTTAQNLQKIDGTGWIPIDFNQLSFGRTLSKLPIDPINNTSSFYSYVYNPTINKYEINGMFESNKNQQIAFIDGGDNPYNYEYGNNLNLMPNIFKNFYIKNNDSGWDWIYSVKSSYNNGYFLAGYTSSFGAGNSDFLVIKLNYNGYIDWAKTVGGTQADVAYSVDATSDGGCIAAGYTNSYGTNSDILVVKFDSLGNIQWTKVIGGSSFDSAYSITKTSEGNYVLAGHTFSYGAGNSDIILIRLNSNGGILNSFVIGGVSSDEIGLHGSIIQTIDGGYAIGGNTSSYGAGSRDMFIIKLDSNFNLEWARTIGGIGDDFVRPLRQSSDGAYIIGGYTTSFGSGSHDFMILRLNSFGNLNWAETIGEINSDVLNDLKIVSDGYILGGYYSGINLSKMSMLISKIDFNGQLQWSKIILSSDNGDYYLRSFDLVSDNGYIISGNIVYPNLTNIDIPIIKLDFLGGINNCSLIQPINPTIQYISPSIQLVSPTIQSISVNDQSFSFTNQFINLNISNICPM
ncbi:MAG: hypothetical protein NZ484_00525, partial [Patescibacteria group bacterium]|nr:hypothetical protein [Patescibacteria group bacterium]